MACRIVILITCFSLLSAGCSSLSMNKREAVPNSSDMSSLPPIKDLNAPKYEQMATGNIGPSRLAVIWTEKVLDVPSAEPVRGYSGRVYFYDTNDQPVRVEGELTIYGYNDSKEYRSEIADTKYVFPAEKFHSHYQESEIGPAYSIWVPWENPDGFRKSITLVPVFKTAKNQIIQGGTTRLTLSGKQPIEESIEKTLIGTHNGVASRSSYSPNYQNAAANQSNANQNFGNQRGAPNERGVQTFQVPRAISSRMTDAEFSRFNATANQQLNQAMSFKQNPNGEEFNRLNVQQFQSAYSNQPFQTTQQMANFNDSSGGANNVAQSIQAYPPQTQGPAVGQQAMPYQPQSPSSRVFGKPGPVR